MARVFPTGDDAWFSMYDHYASADVLTATGHTPQSIHDIFAWAHNLVLSEFNAAMHRKDPSPSWMH